MKGFDTFVVVDWSAAAVPGPVTPAPNQIWIAVTGADGTECRYFRTRHAATAFLSTLFSTEINAGRRVLAGFDFAFGYPRGFAEALTGRADPFSVWEWLDAHIEDAANNANNRFQVGAAINLRFGSGNGPFWGRPAQPHIDGLPTDKHGYENPFPQHREVEHIANGAFAVWQLAYAGAVGSQVLTGLPRLHRLRDTFGADLSVRPFETHDTPIVLTEVYPSLLAADIAARQQADEILDRAQVRVLAETMARLAPTDLNRLLCRGDPEEGWILGAGDEDLLRAALPPLTPEPPPMRNDCFALPAGVDWIPVDRALAHLRDAVQVVVGHQDIPLSQAPGCILAQDILALRSNPPHPNTAVDGYGFAGGRAEGTHVLPLVAERAAAGDVAASVPNGHAIRVLTGAALPDGVDTVVLQEDVTVANDQIAFRGPVKPGANTRQAGEDMKTGDIILTAGRKITPADLALAAATGHGVLPVRARLRVGVISTGDELQEAGGDAGLGKIYDANRPMLLSLLDSWGLEAVDLGHVRDNRQALHAQLTEGASRVDAMLTSGGASAGDEDHVSALLQEAGAMELWRIAVKPGRPLALGMWQGTPVFGLPGNPVAAMVCALIFARPALGVMAGEAWRDPQGFDVPADFTKSKKPGRREYLRARVRKGRVEVFKSEGSGRISGLSWAEGLVELPDDAVTVQRGDLVRFIPFSSFA